MSSRRSMAAAQTTPAKGDVPANTQEHLRLIRAAASEGVRLVVFPELSLTGYEVDLARDLAFTEEDRRLRPLSDAARSHGMTLVVGAPVSIGSRLHIGAFVLSPDGKLEVYTKRRLGAFSAAAGCDGIVPSAEATVFQPGDRDPLVQLGGESAAVAICADTGAADHARRAAARGATIYLASMFVIPSEFDRESANLRRYAVEHGMTVVLANYGGPTGGLVSAGRSSIWSASGALLAQLDARGPGLVVASHGPAGWGAEAIQLS